MLPSNLNLSIRKTVGYNKKISITNTVMKNDSNKDINKDHNLPVTPTEPGRAKGKEQR